MARLTTSEICAMLEGGELSSSVTHRRHTLLALTSLAAKAKGSLDPMSRWRLKKFRAALEAMEGNDEVEVTGETLCEVALLAMNGLKPR